MFLDIKKLIYFLLVGCPKIVIGLGMIIFDIKARSQKDRFEGIRNCTPLIFVFENGTTS